MLEVLTFFLYANMAAWEKGISLKGKICENRFLAVKKPAYSWESLKVHLNQLQYSSVQNFALTFYRLATFLRDKIPWLFPEISRAFLNFSLSNSREENSMECIFVDDHVTKFHFSWVFQVLSTKTQISLSFPWDFQNFSNSLSFPGFPCFPGLWPPCFSINVLEHCLLNFVEKQDKRQLCLQMSLERFYECLCVF